MKSSRGSTNSSAFKSSVKSLRILNEDEEYASKTNFHDRRYPRIDEGNSARASSENFSKVGGSRNKESSSSGKLTSIQLLADRLKTIRLHVGAYQSYPKARQQTFAAARQGSSYARD